jgi:two-component system response regulator RegX3
MVSGSTPEILVVEDDPGDNKALVVELERERFAVRTVHEGRLALEMLEPTAPDLVLLDAALPDMSGVDVCRAIRRRSDVPIIMISGSTSEVDAVVGLEVGADDYVARPLRVRELVARIHVQLRRTANGSREEASRIVVRDVELDRDRHEVFFRGEQISLPLKEFELLELLLANAGRVVSRKTILERVWGAKFLGDAKTLDVHVKRLRKRFRDDEEAHPHIVTIRGVGYRFDVAPWSLNGVHAEPRRVPDPVSGPSVAS